VCVQKSHGAIQAIGGTQGAWRTDPCAGRQRMTRMDDVGSNTAQTCLKVRLSGHVSQAVIWHQRVTSKESDGQLAM
jgi:hypothetical protein